MNELDRRDPLDHLETQFVLAAQPQGRAMQDADWRPIHLIGEDRQFMAHVLDAMDVIISAAVGPVG